MPFAFLGGELVFAGEIASVLESLPVACASLYERLKRPLAAPTADTQILTGDDALQSAAPAWREIERAGGAATPFQGLALARAAADVHQARGEALHIAVVREGGRPVVILPTVLGRFAGLRTLRFLGDPLIQYGDILATADARTHHIGSALRSLAAAAHASLIYLRHVRHDARVAAALAACFEAVSNDAAPYVDLSREPARKARDERELRRFRRRLAELGDLHIAFHEGREARTALREAIEIKRQWLKDRDLTSSVIGDRRWEDALLAASLSADSQFVVGALTIGGRTAALEVGLVHNGAWHAYLGATVAEFGKAGPGHVLMAETFDYCRQRQLRAYDLLPPQQAYKQAVARDAVAVSDFALPLDLRGRIGVNLIRQRPRAKRALAAMPPALRRLLSTAIDSRKS